MDLRRPDHVVPRGLAKGERVGGDVEAINRSREDLFRAFNAADAESFVASVADDVVWMSHSGPPPTIGKEAVQSFYKEFFERGLFIPHVRVQR